MIYAVNKLNSLNIVLQTYASYLFYFILFIHQSTSRKRKTMSQEKHSQRRVKQLCGINGWHKAMPLTC